MARKRKPWWYKAAGVPKFRRKMAKATGIPTTRAGRKAKIRRVLGLPSRRRSGCVVILLVPAAFVVARWLAL